MQFVSFQLADYATGAAIPNGKCFVYLAGTSTLASLYDAGGSPIANPAVASSLAQVGFAAPDGSYDLQPAYADGTLAGPKVLKQQIVDALGFLRVVTPQQFGAAANGSTDDSGAFIAALNYLKSIAVNAVAGFYKGSPKLFIPAGHYYLGTTTLDITHTLIIEGESTGPMYDGKPTLLSWGANCTGIRIQDYRTTGATGTLGSGTYAGTGTLIKGLHLEGGLLSNSAEGEYHAIHARSFCFIENVNGANWQGDFIHINADTGVWFNNASFSQITNCSCHNIRTGFFIDGGDANVCTFRSCFVVYARRWAFWDSAFLGNRFVGCHASASGISNPGYTPSIAVYSGNLYAVVAGQESGASTNAPSGTTADNQWWYYVSAGGVSTPLNYVAWSSGLTWAAGGPYYCDNANAPTTFDDCYSEGGQGPTQLPYLGQMIGGLQGAPVRGAYTYAHNGMHTTWQNMRVEDPSADIYTLMGSGRYPTIPLMYHHNATQVGAGQSIQFGWHLTDTGILHFSTWAGYYGLEECPYQIATDAASSSTAPWGTGRINFPKGYGLAGKKREAGTAKPTSGSYNANDFVENTNRSEQGSAGSKYILLGWHRATTGSSHALNTDWFECRALTGN